MGIVLLTPANRETLRRCHNQARDRHCVFLVFIFFFHFLNFLVFLPSCLGVCWRLSLPHDVFLGYMSITENVEMDVDITTLWT